MEILFKKLVRWLFPHKVRGFFDVADEKVIRIYKGKLNRK